MTALVRLEFDNGENVAVAFNYSSYSDLVRQINIMKPDNWYVVKRYI